MLQMLVTTVYEGAPVGDLVAGRPVPDLPLQVGGLGRTVAEAVTDDAGSCTVDLDDEGEWTVRVDAPVDGGRLVGLMTVRHVIPVRGSTRKKGKDKGGAKALAHLVEVVKQGKRALLAVDGPRGPRSTVHRGVANVSQHSRPILYLLFCRPWFREHINFGSTSLFDDDDEPPRPKKKHRS